VAGVPAGVAELAVARARRGDSSPTPAFAGSRCGAADLCASVRNQSFGDVKPRDIKISFSAKNTPKRQERAPAGGRGRGAKRQGVKQQAAARNTGRGRGAARGRQLSQASRNQTLSQRRGGQQQQQQQQQQQKKGGSLNARFGAVPKAKAGGRGRGRATGRGAGRGRATGRGASRGQGASPRRGGRNTGLRML